jgi:hypothetical protein
MYKPMPIPQMQDTPPAEWRIPQIDGGVCYEDLEFKLLDNQSPYMKNMWYKEKVLTKKPGQEYMPGTSLSATLIIQSANYGGDIIFHSGDKLYKKVISTGLETELLSGLPTTKGSFVISNNILYYINGLWTKYDGTTASVVIPYNPIVVINRTPTGGGDVNESYNRYGAGFINWFNGDNTAVNYTLTQSGLDATEVIITVGGATKVEGVDFTVNRTTGIVTFSVAPAIGQNNVIILAFKTDTAEINKIKNCKFATTFGGDNNTRVFLGGNGTSEYYWSGLQDPSYFPDDNYNLTISGEPVSQFGKQYGILAVFTERSMDRIEYLLDIDGVYFPAKQITSAIGCDMPWTIQVIDNRLVWGNTYGGIYTLVSTNILDERNVQPISRNINGTTSRPGLMQESNKQNAVSVDHDGRYWLCLNGKAFVWDYTLSPYVYSGNSREDARRLSWFYFENINANTFVFDDENLYYGETGKFVKFIPQFKDFDLPIDGIWKSKVLDFDLIDYYKDIVETHFVTTADIDSEINLTFYNQSGQAVNSLSVPPGNVKSFAWSRFDWSKFTFAVIRFAKSIPVKSKMKNIFYFQMEFRNNVVNENLSISDLSVKYKRGKKIK